MNQNPEAAVKPRRNTLKALWASVLGLWASTKLMAQSEEPEIYLIVGRLCLSKDFRNNFFKEGVNPDVAINDTEMVKSKDVREALQKILGAPRKSRNPVDVACEAVGAEIYKVAPRLPCKPWPC